MGRTTFIPVSVSQNAAFVLERSVCMCARVCQHNVLASSHTIFISEESDGRQLVNVQQQKTG